MSKQRKPSFHQVSLQIIVVFPNSISIVFNLQAGKHTVAKVVKQSHCLVLLKHLSDKIWENPTRPKVHKNKAECKTSLRFCRLHFTGFFPQTWILQCSSPGPQLKSMQCIHTPVKRTIPLTFHLEIFIVCINSPTTITTAV